MTRGRSLALVLSLIVVLLLAACGHETATSTPNGTTAPRATNAAASATTASGTATTAAGSAPTTAAGNTASTSSDGNSALATSIASGQSTQTAQNSTLATSVANGQATTQAQVSGVASTAQAVGTAAAAQPSVNPAVATNAANPTPAAQATTGTGTGTTTPTTGSGSTGNPYQLGCGNKDVGAVQKLLGISVVCLGTEYDAYTWRSVPQFVNPTLPDGWEGTFDIGDKVIVSYTPGQYRVQGATFRRIKGYPESDAVYDKCSLLKKEQDFGAIQNPSFKVYPAGFSCDGSPDAGLPATVQGAPAQTGGSTPTAQAASPQTSACLTPETASSMIGGSGWKVLPNSNNEGLKYGPGAPAVTMTAPPNGRIDYASGTINSGDKGTDGKPKQVKGITEATYWCLGGVVVNTSA